MNHTFQEVFDRKVEQEGETMLLDMLNHLYTDDLDIGGVPYACRRVRDTRVVPEGTLVRTEFFCFPKDDKKKKMERGLVVYMDSDVMPAETNGQMMQFSNPRHVGYFKPDRHEMYRGVVAAKARVQIEQAGGNTFLNHDILLTTPEKETVLLDEFDFSRYPLFMLGFVSGEFQIGLQEK